MSINLKRRRNSEDSPTKEGEKRNPKKPTQQQTPSLPQPKGEGEKKIARSPATNERPAQIIPPLPQKQKNTPVNPIEIPLPASLSPITTPKIFTRSQSVTRLSPDPQTASISSTGQKTRAHSASTEAECAMTGNDRVSLLRRRFRKPQSRPHFKELIKTIALIKKNRQQRHHKSLHIQGRTNVDHIRPFGWQSD